MALVDFPVEGKAVQTKKDLGKKNPSVRNVGNGEKEEKRVKFGKVLSESIESENVKTKKGKKSGKNGVAGLKAVKHMAAGKKGRLKGPALDLINTPVKKNAVKERLQLKVIKPDEIEADPGIPETAAAELQDPVKSESVKLSAGEKNRGETVEEVIAGVSGAVSEALETENPAAGVTGRTEGVEAGMQEQRQMSAGKNRGGKENGGDSGERGKFTVVDLRTSGRKSDRVGKAPVENASFNASVSAAEQETGDSQVKIIQLETAPVQNNTQFSRETALPARSDGQMLFQNLKESGNSGIVRQTGIMLKDGGSGEIRLILKPEKLGKVRIRLNLQDNNLAGKIIVENNIVREVFNNNMSELLRAFEEGGFSIGSLDVSVEGGDAGGENGEEEKSPGINSRAVETISESVPLYEGEESLIDLVV